MEKIKVFIGEDFSGNYYFSTISHQDIIENGTTHLMPGGFREIELSKNQLEKLESVDADGCHTHYLKNNRVYSV